MALTIEDGTGVNGADSFVTGAEYVAEVAALFGETVTANEPAIRRAFLYLKSLNWKADYPFPTLGGDIPAEVKQAQSILARYEVATPNGLQPSIVPGQQKVLTQVGNIGWTATGQTGVDAQRAVVTMAADLLKPYVNAAAPRYLDRA
ncbi:MAG: hypothetical protein CMG78_09560 [Marinobacter sp.]|nr:hypothetical protein [Marinobacter sp.]|tara:strand:- start:1103 stop:1543 length:441 start_codon:yes stop_codon:yes gene_type:complete